MVIAIFVKRAYQKYARGYSFPIWTKNQCQQVPRWVFRYVGNKTFDFSRKKRIFCPKTTKFGPKLAFLVNLGQAMQAYSVPCWWVGWWLWRAGCISQDTYLLYCINETLYNIIIHLVHIKK